MPTLTITRGVPGCGKTTAAAAWVAADPDRRARINRDDRRAEMHGTRLGTAGQERQVTAAQHASITALLTAGVDVVCDDTNLPARTVRGLQDLADRAGAALEVWDMTDVPLQVCIDRDAARRARGERAVGERVIRDMHARYVTGRPYPLPLPDHTALAAAPYTPPPGGWPAIMVDLDGTCAIMCDRSPYDETRVGEDQPNLAVIATVRAMWLGGYTVLFCSGRTDACREATEAWLTKHVGIGDDFQLFMRHTGDTRKDSIVKLELFDRHIRDHYRVEYVLDDRQQVVDAWRSIGLTVFQVAPGDF